MEIGEGNLERFFSLIGPLLDERERRLMAAAAAEMIGRGGQAAVARATGMSRNTIIAGAKELAEGVERSERVRRPGGGRKKATDLDPEMLLVLDSLVDPESRGDPMSPLRWTVKSTRQLAGADPLGSYRRFVAGGAAIAALSGLQPAGQRQGGRGQAARRS